MLDFFFLCLLYLTTVIFLASMGLNDNPLDYSVVSNQLFEVRASLFLGFEQAERFESQSLFSEGSVIKSEKTKKQGLSDWLSLLVYQLETWFLAGNSWAWNSYPDSGSQKKLTLVLLISGSTKHYTVMSSPL